MKILILAIGKLRGAEAALALEYQKRLAGEVMIKEMAAATQKLEAGLLLKAIPAKALVIVLDERGRDLSSRELAAKFAAWQGEGRTLAFIIGGADGVTEAIRSRADFMLGLGRKTWPHRLVRIMLLEQLYRAQQINQGHPYHRD